MTDLPTAAAARPRRRLFIGAGLAIAAGAAIVLLFVLPAEYGIDPTGIGKATGLVRISDPGLSAEQQRGALRKGVLTSITDARMREPGREDHWEVELAPYEAIEFKYELEQGKAMIFRWQATNAVHFDMHAHPFEGGEALTESYAIDDAESRQGRYVAPFTGIHGWYWQNRSLEPVRLTLDASGDILGSRIFNRGGEQERPLSPPPAR